MADTPPKPAGPTKLPVKQAALAPRRTLLPSGEAPKTRVRLKGINGQVIEPKLSPEEEAAKAEAEAAAAAEYERQMEEYNRQMEEYNRQLEEHAKAEAEAAAEAAAAAAAEEAQRKAKEEEEARLAAAAQAERQAKEQEEAAALAAQAEAARVAAEAAVIAQAEAARLAAEAAAAEAARLAAAAQAAAAAIGGGVAPAPAAAPAPVAAAPAAAAPAKLPPTAFAAASKPVLSKPATTVSLKPAGAPASPASPVAAAAAPSPLKAASVPAKKAVRPGAAPVTAAALAAKPAMKRRPAAAVAPVEHAEGAEGGEATDGAEAPAEMDPAAAAARDAYLRTLQAQANAQPIWKNPIFLVAAGVILLGGGILLTWMVNNNAKVAAYEARAQHTKKLLHMGQDLTKNRVETLKDANDKNVKVDCTFDECKMLLDVIVNPDARDADGNALYGSNPKGTGQVASVVLAIMAEKDPKVEKLIFETLTNNAKEIDADVFAFLVTRVAYTDIKNIKSKLKRLSADIMKSGKYRHKSDNLAEIWNSISLRTTEKDVDDIIAILADDAVETRLANTLNNCLFRIMEDIDPANAPAVGDKIFSKVDNKFLGSLVATLGRSRSPKAEAYYKGRLKDVKNWPTELDFFSRWTNDDQIDFLIDLYENAQEGVPKTLAKGALGSALTQNIERDEANIKKLMKALFDKIDEDTSAWQEIINKTDPDAADFIGTGSAEYTSLMERRSAIEQCRVQKKTLINMLGSMRECDWVTRELNEFMKDADHDIASDAKIALEKTKTNAVKYMELRAKKSNRSKD